MPGLSAWKAGAIAIPIILLVISTLFGMSYLLSVALGLPSSLGLPTVVRAGGGVFIVAGIALMGWVFSHRRPGSVIVSTYITFTKIFWRAELAEKAGRNEPLIVDGPQRYVRSPLYLGVIVMVLGWAILSNGTFVLVATFVLLIWFGLVLIPFEERELRALFGKQWENYTEVTPMLVPFTKRKKESTSSGSAASSPARPEPS